MRYFVFACLRILCIAFGAALFFALLTAFFDAATRAKQELFVP